jgi:Leucine-rich repeat (LRR) protein
MRLRRVDLSDCGLERLPQCAWRVDGVTHLSLAGNRLRSFPQLNGWSALKELSVDRNQMEQLPDRFDNLRGLEAFSVYDNRLQALPDSLWELNELRVLNVSANQIEHVSPKVGKLKKLQMLDLGHNKISILPDELGDLTSLGDYLYLSDNALTAVPASIGQLDTLR